MSKDFERLIRYHQNLTCPYFFVFADNQISLIRLSKVPSLDTLEQLKDLFQLRRLLISLKKVYHSSKQILHMTRKNSIRFALNHYYFCLEVELESQKCQCSRQQIIILSYFQNIYIMLVLKHLPYWRYIP